MINKGSTRMKLLALFATAISILFIPVLIASASAPKPYPITINSRADNAPPVMVFRANETVFRALFKDGSTASDLTGTTPFMAWSSNATSTAISTSSWTIVNNLPAYGFVDFTFSPESVNHAPGRYIYEIGVVAPTGTRTYRQGVFVIVGSPFGTGADPVSWSTNWNLSLVTLTGTIPLANLSGITSNQMDSGTVAAFLASGQGGTFNHSALSNLTWTASGHEGIAGRLALFSEGGQAGYAGFGAGMYLDGDDNIAASNQVTGASIAAAGGLTNAAAFDPAGSAAAVSNALAAGSALGGTSLQPNAVTGADALGSTFSNGLITAIGNLTPWTGLGYLTAEADTLQTVVTRGGTVTSGTVTIDADNAHTNTFGGLLTVLGRDVRAGFENTVGIYGFGAGVYNTVDSYGFGAGYGNTVGNYGFGAGVLNTVGNYGFGAGVDNTVGNYGFGAGADNIFGIYGFGAGYGNTVGNYGFGAGVLNTVGNYGFGAGNRARCADGSFVFSDLQSSAFDRTAHINAFSVRASGGTYFETPNLTSTGTVTATAFIGDGSQLTGITGGSGGFTNLTFTGSGAVTGGAFTATTITLDRTAAWQTDTFLGPRQDLGNGTAIVWEPTKYAAKWAPTNAATFSMSENATYPRGDYKLWVTTTNAITFGAGIQRVGATFTAGGTNLWIIGVGDSTTNWITAGRAF